MTDKMALLDSKLRELAEPAPDVPKHMYARARMEQHEGTEVPVFTRVRTQTLQLPIAALDKTVDTVCNGSDEEWVLREIIPVAKRPGKYSGGSEVIAIFVCVDKIVLPPPPSATPAESEGIVDTETQEKAAQWEKEQKQEQNTLST